MYEPYTRQALPSKKYRELLGSDLCVFNSNNQFIIENILRINPSDSWYELIDKSSGNLLKDIKNTISKETNKDIKSLFSDIIKQRNRIVHSFQCTHEGSQMLATKEKNNNQVIINEQYLIDFIKLNENLSDKLHELRGF